MHEATKTLIVVIFQNENKTRFQISIYNEQYGSRLNKQVSLLKFSELIEERERTIRSVWICS